MSTSTTIIDNPLNGLPALPKALSMIVSAHNPQSPSQWKETGKIYAAQLAMQQDQSNGPVKTSTPSQNSTDQHKSLTTALSNLRQEMCTLRQQDGHLLCQLMNISSMIAELKAHEDESYLLSESSDLILEDDEYDEDQDPMIITNGVISII